LAEHLGVPVPHLKTVYSCAKLLGEENRARSPTKR
jgi:ketopantoate reductase